MGRQGVTCWANSLDPSQSPSEELSCDHGPWVALTPHQAHLPPSRMGSRFSNLLFSATTIGMASNHCE